MFDRRAVAATIALWLFAGLWIGFVYAGARDPGLRLPDLTTTDRQPN